MNELTFEEAMLRLGQITQTLEKSDIPLEQSIALFEEGLKLTKFCDEKLKGFETKIQTLTESFDGDNREV